MIKIQLKTLEGDQGDYLHLKQIFVVDETGYCMEPSYPCCSEYAWNRKQWSNEGVIRANLRRFVKDKWTTEDFEKEHFADLERMKADYVAKEKHGEWDFNPFEAEKEEEYPFNEEGKKKHVTSWRKAAREAERFGEAFVKCLEKGANLSEEKAQELYTALRKKLVQCCEFGFENLVGDFWFRIGSEVIVEVDNKLARSNAWDEETMARAKAMLVA